MSKKPTAADFAKALRQGAEEDLPPEEPNTPSPPPAAAHILPMPAPRRKLSGKKSLDPELKHFGGYLDDATFEKIALLRLRLKLDNSALIKLAIEELARKHSAKRAFGDV